MEYREQTVQGSLSDVRWSRVALMRIGPSGSIVVAVVDTQMREEFKI